jgi:hypothetical protein|eukprot:scaffold4850_cov265-Chaetoceros_neogracile.AAC.8
MYPMMIKKNDGNHESPLRAFVSLLSTAQSANGVDVPKTSQYLERLFPTLISNETTPCCSLPSLKLLQASKRRGSIPKNKEALRASCAEKLSIPVEFTHEGLREAPTLLIENLMSSFNYLVKSRITSSLRALASQSSGDHIKKKIIMKVLTDPNIKPIDFTTVVTSFQPFDEVVPSYMNCAASDERMKLFFEITMDVCLLGKVPLTVNLRTSGIAEDTSRVAVNGTAEKLKFVRIELDSNLLLQQMMAQARFAAKKALQIAADVAQAFIISYGISSSNVSLVSMSSQGSDLLLLSKRGKEIGTQSNYGTMPPPPPRLPQDPR